MDLRPEPLPPPVSQERQEQLGRQIGRIAELARDAARPDRLKVPDITREELAEIVRRIMQADPELQDATAEEIVDAALSYRPIAL
ncbi:hypothetical protein [Nonomuraea insulae]|uniref:Uncharacterized protein n=1 Tax=Nonomuraea insulae TaxID=1616787 RepID=A0ABW1D7N6_9ACTN